MNVRRALEAAGTDAASVTAMTVYLTDMSDLRAFSAIRKNILGEMLTTSTAVQVGALALPGMVVEVTVIAVRQGI